MQIFSCSCNSVTTYPTVFLICNTNCSLGAWHKSLSENLIHLRVVSPMNTYSEFLSGDFATRISNCRATYLSTKVGEVFLQTFVLWIATVICLPVSGSLVKILLELKYTSGGGCFQQEYSILYRAFSKIFAVGILMAAKLYFRGGHHIYLGMLEAAYSTIFIAFLFSLVPLGFEDKIIQN